jgi:hypothetical protein
MPWSIVLEVVAAAAAGITTREVAGRVAEHFGHSRTKAENAVATGGLSLVFERNDERSVA